MLLPPAKQEEERELPFDMVRWTVELLTSQTRHHASLQHRASQLPQDSPLPVSCHLCSKPLCIDTPCTRRGLADGSMVRLLVQLQCKVC